MEIGTLDKRITIMRRAVADESNPGVTRGAFAEAGSFWASIQAFASKDVVNSGVDQDATILKVRVRDSSQTRLITIADALRYQGRDYRIQSVTPPDRRLGYIELTASRILPSAP